MVDVVYLGPSDNLHLAPDGPAYHPGDVIKTDAETIARLTAYGQRFAFAHSEEELAELQARFPKPTVEVPPTPDDYVPASVFSDTPAVEVVPPTPVDYTPSAEMVAEVPAEPEPEPDPVPVRRGSRKDGD